ncbi:MAG TPA: TIGR02710 family CRISPR-associated CARF protein [Terriglobales bacterium]|nr:TIGR02710 family CRISPR-associated CARF protein [Terriglobales bacterium]
MSVETPVKALLIAFSDDASAAVYSINRLKPESLCFFLPESAKSQVETAVQPHIAQMPRRWDWVVTPDACHFMASYQALARSLPDILWAWEVCAGELVVDLTGSTPAMAAALALAGMAHASRVVALGHSSGPASDRKEEGEAVLVEGRSRLWIQGNPWDEAAAHTRREGCDLFNRGAFGAAAALFRQIETRVSGGQKPFYRAFADLAEGYGLWERFQHRQAWDKLKTATKALDMASLWGGPPGVKALLPAVKGNAVFLERLVLDPQEVKESMAYELLAHARRRAEVDHHVESALATLLRALEAFAQWELFKQHGIKTWDVRPEQLPEALREPCRTCYLDDVDGKYKLPLYSQFRALAGLGNQMGQAYLANWAKMKPLLDAAGQAVLGHGFEPVKPERFHQLYEVVVKLTGVSESALPRFPVLAL